MQVTRSKILITTAPELKNNDDQNMVLYFLEQLQKIAQDQGMGNPRSRANLGIGFKQTFSRKFL